MFTAHFFNLCWTLVEFQTNTNFAVGKLLFKQAYAQIIEETLSNININCKVFTRIIR